jgi:hypothetical protein
MAIKELINTGKWSLEDIEQLIRAAVSISGPGERISYLSRQFLGVKYEGNTLTGDIDTEEIFTINFEGVDCFTLVDYVEAMRLSSSFAAFRAALRKVRYQNGMVSFDRRNHFFTDWAVFNRDKVEDISLSVAPGKTRLVKKQLNVKEDGLLFVPGIKVSQREINYVPSTIIDDAVIDSLETGDYIGIYSGLKGLDVSHIGIYIREGDNILLRHASSRSENMRVLDEDFMAYVSTKPGIIVLRPCEK